MLSSDEGEKVKPLLAIDGKTQRGNGNKNQKANHIVSAVDDRGYQMVKPEVERAVRGHWMIESYHWHLDATFREDGNPTLEKPSIKHEEKAVYNWNKPRKTFGKTCEFVIF